MVLSSYVNNMAIFKSASKLVFVLLAVTACASFLLDKLPVDQFMLLATGAFAFYFSNKGDQGQQYLGK